MFLFPDLAVQELAERSFQNSLLIPARFRLQLQKDISSLLLLISIRWLSFVLIPEIRKKRSHAWNRRLRKNRISFVLLPAEKLRSLQNNISSIILLFPVECRHAPASDFRSCSR